MLENFEDCMNKTEVVFCFREKLLAKSREYYLCYYRGSLIVKNKNLNRIRKVRIHKRLVSFPLVERLLRKEPRISIPINQRIFLYTDCGALYMIDAENGTISMLCHFEKGMNNPLSFCVRRGDDGEVQEVIYGEYIWNDERGPVSIYKLRMRNDNPEITCVFTFPKGTIQHIHNVTFDAWRKRYIILTGDGDLESVIWEADVDFSNVRPIVGGEQIYRSCVCLPTQKGIFYATDTPLRENHLFFLDNHSALSDISALNGPCIYGTIKDGSLYFASSVEGDPTLGKWRYRFSNKLGKGVKDRYVRLYKLDESGHLSELERFKKDALPMWLFQFGNIQFPFSDDFLYFTTQSTKKKGTYKVIENDCL